jgi:hypothetical protein
LTLTSTESEIGAFTLEQSTEGGTDFTVNNGSGYSWDGNGSSSSYKAVSWSGSGHTIRFYEVTAENSTSTYYYPVTVTYTLNGSTLATATDVYLADGSSIYGTTETVSADKTEFNIALDSKEGRAIKIRNVRQTSKYVVGSLSGRTCVIAQGTDANASIFWQVGEIGSCKLYNPATLRWVGATSGGSTPTALAESDAATYTIEVERAKGSTGYYYSESISWDGSGSDGWNDYGGTGTVVGSWSKTDVGSRWYTMAYDEGATILAANTSAVCADLLEALDDANSVYSEKQSDNSIDQSLLTALKSAIDATASIQIGFDKFEPLTTALNEAVAAISPITPMKKALTNAQAVLEAYPTAEHSTPGYFNATDEAYTTFKAAVDKLKSLVDANNTENYKDAIAEMKSATATFEAARPATAYFTSLYRIVNADANSRGKLYYNDGYDQVYSTGKTAYSGNDDDDAMLWAFVENNGETYLYNVGANKFINATKTQADLDGQNYTGNFWSFGDGADITLTAAPGFSYPILEISSNGTHMSISNSYAAPIISYYTQTDGGVPFKFEYVKEIPTETADAIKALLGGESSVIVEVDAAVAPASAAIYDLQGRRVARAAHGLYIINGKKVMM